MADENVTDEGTEENTGTDDEGTENDGTTEDTDTEKKTDGGDDSGAKAEAARYKARMVAADKRASELEKRLKAIEDKDKTELQRATDEANELKQQHAAALESLKKTRLENAFHTDNTVSWHNSKTAFALLNLSDVDIDDDGKVNGMKEAIKDLAKREPYLVKTEDSSTEASGSSINGRKGGGNKVDRNSLAKDFPALNRR